jgi:hypothetical protein
VIVCWKWKNILKDIPERLVRDVTIQTANKTNPQDPEKGEI